MWKCLLTVSSLRISTDGSSATLLQNCLKAVAATLCAAGSARRCSSIGLCLSLAGALSIIWRMMSGRRIVTGIMCGCGRRMGNGCGVLQYGLGGDGAPKRRSASLRVKFKSSQPIGCCGLNFPARLASHPFMHPLCLCFFCGVRKAVCCVGWFDKILALLLTPPVPSKGSCLI